MVRFVTGLVRPYRRTLVIILLAMLVQTLMTLASPWPLKVILDSVVGRHKISPLLERLIGGLLPVGTPQHIAGVAALAFVFIAGAGAAASYVNSYFTESVGQWVAHDLRMQTYHHLQRLSLGYYSSQSGVSARAASASASSSTRPGIPCGSRTSATRIPS